MEFTEKSRMRRAVLERRDALAAAQRQHRSQTLCARVLALGQWRAARVILATVAMGSEPDTALLLHKALEQGKTLVLPRVQRAEKSLGLYAVQDLSQDLLPGVWGILEPDPQRCAQISLSQVDLVVVPGVAFDQTGARLGYGAGYYDRLLARQECTAQTVAMAFDEQLVPRVPMDDHDQRVQLLLTDSLQQAGSHWNQREPV